MVIKEKAVLGGNSISREEMISRAGRVSADNVSDNEEWSHFCLRIPKKMLQEIDQALKSRIGIKKTGYILEAIQEKLRKTND